MTYLSRPIKLEDLDFEVIDGINAGSEGAYYKCIKSADVVTTTSTNWQNKVAYTTENLNAGLYKLSWSYQWNMDDTSRNFVSEIVHNDGTGDIVIFTHSEEPGDQLGSFGSTGSDQQLINTAFDILSLSGVHTFVIKYKSGKSGKKASIWNAKLELQSISSDTANLIES